MKRTAFKVRLYKSRHVPGMWVACYVTDCAPAPDGCRQRPVPYLKGAYGRTPRSAYSNLMMGSPL